MVEILPKSSLRSTNGAAAIGLFLCVNGLPCRFTARKYVGYGKDVPSSVVMGEA